ncbi:hypothetical protein V7S43_001378 [Phytophthora oleae]|uniref:Uncharacterized protein n=1 Tax=Phytophthora oleae TaxID=2107226 RepID=A0ABD3G3I8_9STRA
MTNQSISFNRGSHVANKRKRSTSVRVISAAPSCPRPSTLRLPSSSSTGSCLRKCRSHRHRRIWIEPPVGDPKANLDAFPKFMADRATAEEWRQQFTLYFGEVQDRVAPCD